MGLRKSRKKEKEKQQQQQQQQQQQRTYVHKITKTLARKTGLTKTNL